LAPDWGRQKAPLKSIQASSFSAQSCQSRRPNCALAAVISHQVFPLHVVGRYVVAIVIFSDNGLQDRPSSHPLLILGRQPELDAVHQLFQ